MDGWRASSYGDAFADVYDDWYAAVSDVAATVRDVVALAEGGAVLELGVGTGRLALALADAGLDVHGLDASAAMLDRLRAKDPAGRVATTLGDMVADLPAGAFAVVLVAYNTLFNLTEPGAQADCFRAVAARLTDGGRFVVEAFVPETPPLAGDRVSVRTLDVDRVVLSVSVHDPVTSTASGQFVELSETTGVRLRPWSIRYATTAELDAMAAAAGLALEHRWRAFGDHGWDDDAERHVSVYRRT